MNEVKLYVICLWDPLGKIFFTNEDFVEKIVCYHQFSRGFGELTRQSDFKILNKINDFSNEKLLLLIL